MSAVNVSAKKGDGAFVLPILPIPPPVKTSVIICTRNRADSLAHSLESISHAEIPPEMDVEILVVDNGSSDHTREILKSSMARLARLRIVTEPVAGLSKARNAGIAASTGDIILFTDDDVRVPRDWIARMTEPIIKGADAVSGGIEFPPHILSNPEFNALGAFGGWFASTVGLDEISPDRMVGVNMAFHRRVLARVPKFNEEVGPGGTGFGDDTLFARELVHHGFRLVAALDVRIEHHFDVTRLETKNMVDAARKMGRSHAYEFHHFHHRSSRLRPIRGAIASMRLFLNRKRGDPSHLLAEKEAAFWHELRVQRRRPHYYPN